MPKLPDDQKNYTVKTAAKRVQCSTRTIQRWIRDGMVHRRVQGFIIIDHAVLQAEKRKRAASNPKIKTHPNIDEISRTMS